MPSDAPPPPPPGVSRGGPAASGASAPASLLVPPVPDSEAEGGFLPPHFLEAFVHCDHILCGERPRRGLFAGKVLWGVRLPPYSLHTHLMLCAVGSPFACDFLPAGFQLTWEDVWIAVAAITTPYGRTPRYPRGWLCVARQRLLRLDLKTEVEALLAWRSDHLSAPDLFCDTGEGRPLTAPSIIAKAAFLYRHAAGLGRREIWTMSLGELLWTHGAILEQVNEHVSLLRKADAELLALVKKMQDGEVLPPRPDDTGHDDRLGRVAAAAGLARP